MSTRGQRGSRYMLSVYERNGASGKGANRKEFTFWEASWEKPRHLRAEGEGRHIRGTSRTDRDLAIMRCEENIADWLAQAEGRAPAKKGRRVRRPEAPVNTSRTDHTVQSFLEEWYQAQIDSDRWADSSSLRIAQAFRDYIYPYIGSIPLGELTMKQVRIHFNKTLPNIPGKTKKGVPTGKPQLGTDRIEYIFTNFRAAIRKADAKNWIDGDPTFHIHLKRRTEPAREDEHIEELMNFMLKVFRDPKDNDVDTLRYSLSFFCGMRRGERCGIWWSDIDDLNKERPQITIQRQLSYHPKKHGGEGNYFSPSTKTGRSRKFPLPKRVVELLRDQRKRVDEWKKEPGWNPSPGFDDVILIRRGGKVDPINDDNIIFRRWLRSKGFDDSKVAPNSLRHASATWWASVKNKDKKFLQQVLGWHEKSDLDRYYTRVLQAQLVEEIADADQF